MLLLLLMIPVPLHTAAVVFENDEDDDALFFFARAESRLLLLFLLLFKEETSKADFNECVEKDIYACVRVCVCVCVRARVCSNALWMIGTCVWRAFHSGEEKPPVSLVLSTNAPKGFFLDESFLKSIILFYSHASLKKMNALKLLYFSSLAL